MRLIYQLTHRGFCSELNQLLLAYLYCLDQGIEFRLSSRYWGAAHNKGWTDYFEPFCKEQNNRFTRIGTITRLPARIARRQRLYKSFFRGTLFTHDVWDAMQAPDFLNKSFHLPDYGIDGDIFHAKQALLKQIYRLNSKTEQALREMAEPIPTPYAAIHVRRGDKLISEAKPVELDDYIKTLQAVAPDIKHVFLATDDYAVVSEFKERFPDYTVTTHCQPARQGYRQAQFNQGAPEQKRRETLDLMADIQCIAAARHFVGTFSSNIGRFVALMIGLDRCTSLDTEWHAL